MPPKKDQAADPAAGPGIEIRKAAVVDGISIYEMTKEQLQDHILRCRDETDREREERNYFQIERDKIASFWEIAKKQLEEKRAELRNKDRELEDVEERHQMEIKIYKQKIKHLLYEHQNNLSEVKAGNLINLKLAEEEHALAEHHLMKDKREMKIRQKEDELVHVDAVNELKLKQSEKLTEMRIQLEKNLGEVEERYDKKMRTLRDELDLQRKSEVHEVEERKNQQINTLMKNHEKAFTDIKNYYNDITVNNLALINTLKEQAEELKKRSDHVERQLHDAQIDNRKLHDDLKERNEKIEVLKKVLEQFENTKNALASTKHKLKTTAEELKTLQWEQEIVELKFKEVENERDEIYNKFVTAIHEVQQKSSLKNLLLERKLTALSEALEKREVQLNEVLIAAKLDPTSMSVVTRKLEDLLDSKNSAIKDLQLELARVCKAHDELLGTFGSKLKSYGINTDDLGFVPLNSTSLGHKLGKGAAGLASKCP
uniref:Dynein regulatory complex subunit 4 n=1 Tax=Strigamia maritima TaxID=126957 RepID=T1J0M2_STRMM